MKRLVGSILLLLLLTSTSPANDLRENFLHPSPEARPWVYWYFMDGQMTAEGIKGDLEAMKNAGIGGGIFLQVNLGSPPGPVPFMSDRWRNMLLGAISEADRLGLQIALGTGPGWCGDGGPWVTPENAMQHLVGAETSTTGPARFDQILYQPKPRDPFFGIGTLTPPLKLQWQSFYRDVAVVAFPTPAGKAVTADVNEKALYFRPPFSSQPGVKPFLPDPAQAAAVPPDQCVQPDQVIDLTGKMDPTGRLTWDVPPGSWTIVRLGRTLTGQTTRPAPAAGLGFETDKFDQSALDSHFASYIDKIVRATPSAANKGCGLTMLHFDSWEMSSQNWSKGFRDAFRARRGYDPLPFLPAMLGRIIGSRQITERFLWDIRQTAQELTVENHVMHLRDLAHQRGLTLSIEPYDLDPCADLKLGMAADLPMGEFWSTGYGYPTEYSIIEATSVGHTMGRPVIGAESFTSSAGERWKQYPDSMKAQADWALCAGINKFVIHRFEHQPEENRFPGMTMGVYGVHWDRTQTWWDFVAPFHGYLTRCCQTLRQGIPVADVLYLTPEGAPMVFRPPPSATRGPMQDRLGYNFDGCCPDVLLSRVSVVDGKLVLPGGVQYRLLVLPECSSMTPALLRKISDLLNAGATVIGKAPVQSPSLSDYPNCDRDVQALVHSLWGSTDAATQPTSRQIGKGRLILDTATPIFPALYPDYQTTSHVLQHMRIAPDFESDLPLRYTHRRTLDQELYFIANPDKQPVSTLCHFRAVGKPMWWDPLTGDCKDLSQYTRQNGITTIPIQLDPTGSGFVIFTPEVTPPPPFAAAVENFPAIQFIESVPGPWDVHFDPAWGAPDDVAFNTLQDWTQRPEPGIRAYSGKAIYRATFIASPQILQGNQPMCLSLGDVKDIASVNLNGTNLGVAWCSPWRLQIPPKLLRPNNQLQITIANLWINRLITDAGLPTKKRLTKTTWNPFKPSDPLQPSGLLGPVELESVH